MNVLVVEDDPSISGVLVQAVREAGHDVRLEATGAAGQAAAMSSAYDVVLLDVMLPDIDGLRVCRALRGEGIVTPVLMITARDTEADKIAGLDSGADDYIVKPFQLGELLARMRALVRRSALPPVPLRCGDLELDPVRRVARRGGRTIHLSATEYALLECLMRARGQVCTRAAILQEVWQYDFNGCDNVLDVYISYVRAKIDRGSSEPLIHTERGVGFRMAPGE